MADNTVLNTGSGGDTVRDKDRAGVKTQIVGIDTNVGGTEALLGPTNPLPSSIIQPGTTNFAAVSPMGELSVGMNGTVWFLDTFDTLDTVNTWTPSGTVLATILAGTLSVNPSTTASATSVINSQPTFNFISETVVALQVKFETTTIALGNHRFFGLGTPPSVPGTSVAPLQDAIGFEIDTAGVLRASEYTAGSRTFTQALTVPVDGLVHNYILTLRGDVAFFMLDNTAVPVAFTYTQPGKSLLPLRIASLNSASVTGTPTMAVTGAVIIDQSRNASGIADGNYPWRRARVGSGGDLSTSITSPNAAALGIFALLNPYGGQRVSVEPTIQFFDGFDGAIDPIKWTIAGTQVPTVGTSSLIIAPTIGASVNNTSTAISPATFISPGLGVLLFGSVITLEAAQTNVVNVHRFWGKGQVTSYAYTTPLTDGIGFEVEGATGALQCVVYVAGTKYVINSSTAANVSSSIAGIAGAAGTALPTSAIGTAYGKQLPWLGGTHRYAIMMRSDVIYWFAEGQEVPVAAVSYLTPNVQATPLRFAAITNGSATSLANTFLVGAVTMSDSTAQNKTISDATYPWRRARVSADGTLSAAPTAAATGTYTSVAAAVADTSLLAANVNRRGATIYNESAVTMYLGMSATAASLTAYSCQIAPGSFFEVPYNYQGAIRAYWPSATGNARITELT